MSLAYFQLCCLFVAGIGTVLILATNIAVLYYSSRKDLES